MDNSAPQGCKNMVEGEEAGTGEDAMARAARQVQFEEMEEEENIGQLI